MAETLNFPSMFDTRQAISRQMQDDAMKAGANFGGGKRGGMYYGASLSGDRYGQGLMGLAGMMGGEPDPRIGKQQALDEIMQRFPNPEPPEDFIEIANGLQGIGLYTEANTAMDMANEIRTSMPKAVKPAADIEKYNEAVKGGYEGTFYQFLMDLKKAGADSTTMMTPPAKGFQYIQDDQGNWKAEIIPGGSADLEIQAADEKALLAKVNTQKAGNVVLKNVGLVRNAIKNPQTFFGMEVGATGWGSLLKDIPATQAKGVAGMIATIKGNVGFDKLQAMREASPTGGALGQVSELELKLLMSTIGSLDQAQSESDLLRVLGEIEYWYNHIVHGAAYASTAVEETEEVEDPLGVL